MLRLEGVTKSFGSLTALSGIDMQVVEGTIHGLIGPNGSGKSTTMNVISGTYKPTAGTIMFEGEAIGGLASHEVARRGVIRTFQLTRIFSELTVFEAVRLGVLGQSGSGWNPLRWMPFPRNHASNDEVASILERLGLSAYARQNAGQLPGGIRRILAIATAVAAKPKLLLLDEPLAGLNATEKAEVANRIEALRAAGITILLVEHDVRSVMRLCKTITVINFGKVIATGSPEEVSKDGAVIEAYLGHQRGAHAAR
jgi:ABC-type branched-subunit amino acid transport system ATPase component